MSKHSHISAIFDNAFQSRAGSPDVYMSMSRYQAVNRLDGGRKLFEHLAATLQDHKIKITDVL